MKSLFKALAMLTFLGQLFSATVDGYAYLEGETDHSNIQVFFQRVVPDTLASYTTSTDSTGYYSSVVEGGWYDITYSHNGFVSKDTADVTLYSDTTLEDIILSDINMIFEAGVHVITENIEVLEGDTLIIKPGARMELDTGIGINVYGMIIAEGTENDSIVFTGYNGRNWDTVTLYNSCSDDSKINHCYFEKSGSCALYISSCYLTVSNCTFYNNTSGLSTYASGITTGGNQLIEKCRFYNNNGGGVMVINNGYYVTRIDNCIFKYNNRSAGGAICIWNAGPEISNCIIQNNTSGNGGGIYTDDYKSGTKSFPVPVISNCLITNNDANEEGSGIWVGPGSAEIYNSVISHNYNSGIYTYKNIKIYNSIVTNNSNYGIYNNSGYYTTGNNNFYGNSPDEIYNKQDYLLVNVTTNSNADSCDAYGNISMDPILNEDFRLQSDSPCIDAGMNTIGGYTFPIADLDGNYRIWDGDDSGTSIVDIGAYEYGSYSVGIEDQAVKVQNFTLYQNYPNPFNPVTSISYALPQASQVELNVYNLQGQLVQSLVNSRLDKGIHKAEFNAGDLTSGMYIYNLKVDNKVVSSKKMMLLK